MKIETEVETRPRRYNFAELLVEFDGDKGTPDEGETGRLIRGMGGSLIMQYGEHEGVIDAASLFSNWVDQLKKGSENAS